MPLPPIRNGGARRLTHEPEDASRMMTKGQEFVAASSRLLSAGWRGVGPTAKSAAATDPHASSGPGGVVSPAEALGAKPSVVLLCVRTTGWTTSFSAFPT